MAAQLICNQWVAGSTPVTSSKKSYDIPLKSGVCRGAFAFVSPTASPPFRKIMPPGGARVLKSAHHDAAVVFGGVKYNKRNRPRGDPEAVLYNWQAVLRTTSQSASQTRPGCGTQHPLRSACVLLAAAPTMTPCFRHWRRSSSLPLVGEPLAKRKSFTKCQGLPSVGEVAQRQLRRRGFLKYSRFAEI